MLKSLKPFATPFLNDGTIRACVASLERSERLSLMVAFATTYWFSESCLTSFDAEGAAGIGAMLTFNIPADGAPVSMYSLCPSLSISTRSLSMS